MQHNEQDVLAILEFDLAEQTIGIWLRRIMRCLEEKRDVRKGLPQLRQKFDPFVESVPHQS